MAGDWCKFSIWNSVISFYITRQQCGRNIHDVIFINVPVQNLLWILHATESVEFLHNKASMDLLKLMTINANGFDPRLSAVVGECTNHYTMESNVIAISKVMFSVMSVCTQAGDPM